MKLAVICLVACCFASLNGQYYRPGRHQNQQFYMRSPKALFYPGFGYIFSPYVQPFSYGFDDHQNDQVFLAFWYFTFDETASDISIAFCDRKTLNSL